MGGSINKPLPTFFFRAILCDLLRVQVSDLGRLVKVLLNVTVNAIVKEHSKAE